MFSREEIRKWLYKGPLPKTIGIAFHNFLGALLIAWLIAGITDKKTNTIELSLIPTTPATFWILIYLVAAYLYLQGLHQYESNLGHWKESEKNLLGKLEPAMEAILTQRIADGEITSLQDLRRELET